MEVVILYTFIHFIKVGFSQPEADIPCDNNYYYLDSECRPCIDDICKTVFQKNNSEYEKCRNYCSKTPQYMCNNMRKNCSDTNTKYEDCLKHLLSNIKYPCNNVTKNSPDTPQRITRTWLLVPDTPQRNTWIWLLVPGFLAVFVISVIIGLVMASAYIKYENKNGRTIKIISHGGFVKDVIVNLSGSCLKGSTVPPETNGRNINNRVLEQSEPSEKIILLETQSHDGTVEAAESIGPDRIANGQIRQNVENNCNSGIANQC